MHAHTVHATQVAQHLRALLLGLVVQGSKQTHAHMKINEMVVLYIDKTEVAWPTGEGPSYSTRIGISSEYSFLMRGAGLAEPARCVWLAVCIAVGVQLATTVGGV